ncbi:MAG: hypothetical protein SOT28_03280 [Fusicatenibacter sp.]|nr:hypothetical protein [Lachnospiraceae bacterium]MDY2937324.1 hypothetical protein [Fusicatenibacter sp.]
MRKQNPLTQKLREFGYENTRSDGSLSRLQKSVKELEGALKKINSKEKKKR